MYIIVCFVDYASGAIWECKKEKSNEGREGSKMRVLEYSLVFKSTEKYVLSFFFMGRGNKVNNELRGIRNKRNKQNICLDQKKKRNCILDMYPFPLKPVQSLQKLPPRTFLCGQ